MAYADSSSDILTDEEKKAQEQALGTPTTTGSSSGATTTGNNSAAAPATSSGAPSFVNLADYVSANDSVKDVGANAINNQVNSDLTAANTDLTNSVNSQTQAASTAGSPGYTDSQVDSAISGNDPETLTGLSNWWSTAETPSAAPVMTASDAILKDQSALADDSTRQQQLTNIIGPSAAPWLDNAIYGKSAKTAQDSAATSLASYLDPANGAVTNANTAISTAWQNSDTAKKEAKQRLKDHMQGIQTGLSNQIQDTVSNENFNQSKGKDYFDKAETDKETSAKDAFDKTHDDWVKNTNLYKQYYNDAQKGYGKNWSKPVADPGPEPVYTPYQKREYHDNPTQSTWDPNTNTYTGSYGVDPSVSKKWGNISNFLSNVGPLTVNKTPTQYTGEVSKSRAVTPNRRRGVI